MPKLSIFRLFTILITATVLTHTLVFGQNPGVPAATGVAKGSVKDSVHNIMLQSATVAVYRFRDSTLLKYQLTNSFGEFQFNNLPLDTQLSIVVSYIGYKSLSTQFSLSEERKSITFKVFNLERSSDAMQEVFVVPPVRLNGDTLEFNAAAFTLDKNAVAEDLLKKLPGVIVWGDGTITVNGRQIKQLLVEGKPFFGDDARIATQNLPKDAIQKVQVYTEPLDPYNPLDSITTVNIKLRAKARKGHFGKIEAGSGTDKQYQADGSLNLYSPRELFGMAAASNNVNKIAPDIYTLMRNNTFKGVSATVDYQPDFSLQGVNQSSSGGFAFQHDFIPNPSSYKQNRLSLNSFIDDNINKTKSHTNTIAAIGNDSTLSTNNSSDARAHKTALNLEAKYEKRQGENSLKLMADLSAMGNNTQLQQENAAYGSVQNLQSEDFVQDSSKATSKSLEIGISFDHQGFSTKNIHKLSNYSLDYSAKGSVDNLNRLLNTNFFSTNNPLENEYYNRSYHNRANSLNQSLSLKVGDFSSWLFSDSRFLSNFYFNLKNDLTVNVQGVNNLVKDKDTLAGVYLFNTYLTNTGTYVAASEMPDLNFGRTFLHMLANRFQKTVLLDFDVKLQVHSESNSSDHTFLNYSNQYTRFVPSIKFQYTNSQFGSFLDNYELRFSITSNYPDVSVLRPLVDSSAIYSIHVGNIGLQPATNNDVIVKFRHDNFRSKNTFNYGLQLSGGFTKDYLADSALVDGNGRYYYYVVNRNGYKHFEGEMFINKAFKFGDEQIQFSLLPHLNLSSSPGVINYRINNSTSDVLSDVLINTDTLAISYTYKNFLALNLTEIIGYYHSRQSGLSGNEFNNNLSATKIGLGIVPINKLLLQSSVSYSKSTSTGISPTRFTIWNADASYRFLKDNSLEIKFSALDILHQNKGIFNYGSTYSLSRETINVLQQYFMLTIAYFPRNFGKK